MAGDMEKRDPVPMAFVHCVDYMEAAIMDHIMQPKKEAGGVSLYRKRLTPVHQYSALNWIDTFADRELMVLVAATASRPESQVHWVRPARSAGSPAPAPGPRTNGGGRGRGGVQPGLAVRAQNIGYRLFSPGAGRCALRPPPPPLSPARGSCR
jgi:hypothetical protein